LSLGCFKLVSCEKIHGPFCSTCNLEHQMVRALVRVPHERVDGWTSSHIPRVPCWRIAATAAATAGAWLWMGKTMSGHQLIPHRSVRCWRGLPWTAAAAAGTWSWQGNAIAKHDSCSRENDCQGKSAGKCMYEKGFAGATSAGVISSRMQPYTCIMARSQIENEEDRLRAAEWLRTHPRQHHRCPRFGCCVCWL